MIDEVTFGIVSFNRPAKLARLLESIDQWYPEAIVTIAENGLTGWWEKTLTTMDEGRRVFLMPFDAGCAAARNLLIDECGTEFLLFLEEDFEFTANTRIQPLIEILKHDPSIGMAGGRVDPGPEPPNDGARCLPSGVGYTLARFLRMFAVGRREFFADHRFDPLLKTGEHGPFMTEVRDRGKWKLAFRGDTSIAHHPGDNPEEYDAYRQRAREFRDAWKEHRALEAYLALGKDKTRRSLFGKRGQHMFGHGDLLFLEFVLARCKQWRNCVELGTGSGLTTLYLATVFGLRRGTVNTFDRRRGPFVDAFPPHVTFRQADILTHEHSAVIEAMRPPNTFVFFDDGKKRQEVAMYAKYLQPGSGFIVHDWPKEFGPEDVPPVLDLGFEEFQQNRARLFNSACRCFIRVK